MGIFWSRPQPIQEPVIITQAGLPGQTTVVYGAQPYGYGYGYDPALVGVALTADIVSDVIVTDMIIDSYYGGKKGKRGKNIKKIKKTKSKKLSK